MKKKEDKNLINFVLGSGLVLSIILLIIFGVSYNFCKNNPRLDCLFAFFLIPSPGTFIDNLFNLNMGLTPILIISLVVWFIVGALIALLISKIKSKSKK